MTKLFGTLVILAMVGTCGMGLPAMANHHEGGHAAPAAKACAKCHKAPDKQGHCACKKDAKHDEHHGDAKHEEHHGDAKHEDHGDAKHEDHGSHH